MDVAPDSFPLTDLEGLPTLQGLTGDVRYLVAAGVSWAGSVTINGGWTNNCDLQRAAATTNNNLVDITVKVPSLRKRSYFSNVLDVIVDLVVKLAEFVGFFDIAKDSRAGCMDVIRWCGALRETSDNGFSGGDVITVGKVENNVGL